MVERNLSAHYLGLTLPSPIVAASCGLTKSVDNIRHLERAGAGAIVLKSIFEEQIRAGVAELVEAGRDSLLHAEAAEYLQAYGEQDAVERTLSLIRSAKQAVRIPVIASVHCVSPGVWTDFARRVEDAGADALELNIFVFPGDPRRSAADNEQIYFDILGEVKRRVTLPVALKIGPYFSSLGQTIQRLSRSGAAGLVLFNRFHRPDYDIQRLSIGSAPYFSDPHEIHEPLRWIAISSGEAACDLAASTGVHDGAGLIKVLLAGAAVAQVATTLYKNGIDHVGVMLLDLGDWMERHHFKTLEEFRGKLGRSQVKDPATYERVQFMKMTTGVE